MKLYHEAPLVIFEEVQKVTDGDYALVHLFKTNPSYLHAFEQALADGRSVILDNSLYELRDKFDGREFAYWVERLRPTYYIVPDVWKDCRKTIESFFAFIQAEGQDLPGLRIGVAQGLEVEDTVRCYEAIAPYCDMVAFNFDGSHYFYKQYPNLQRLPTCIAMGLGRVEILEKMYALGAIDLHKEHHLLGCATVQEGAYYRAMPWLTSLDTSNPVVHGLFTGKYPMGGYNFKGQNMIADVIDMAVTPEQYENVLYNINMFRRTCK